MGEYDAIIDSVFPDAASRRIARAAVEQFSDIPGMDMWIRGGLSEFGHVNQLVQRAEMTAEEGRELLFSTMDGSGFPPHLRAQINEWYDATLETEATAAAEAATEPEPEAEQPAAPAQAQPAQVQPPVQPAPAPAPPAGPSRAQLQAEIARHEANMKSVPGSDQWRDYWQRGGSAQYLAALQAMETAPETAAAPAPAGTAAPPAESAGS